MNKSDLKDGMILKLRDNNVYSLLHGYLLELSLNDTYKIIASIDDYDDEFINCNVSLDDSSVLDIIKIYDKDLKLLLWERKEVDWSKVPFGTKVVCWNEDDTVEYEGKFLEYDEKQILYKYQVYVKGYTEHLYKYCKLEEDQKEEVTYNGMMKSIDKICDKNYKKNKTCCGCIAFNSNGLCNRSVIADANFTITRK